MTHLVDNVIWGTDFRGRAPTGTEIPKAELSTLELMAVDVFGMIPLPDFFNALHDTEYVAPTDDCA